MSWIDNMSCGHLKECNNETSYKIENVINEYEMDGCRIFRTGNRDYVGRKNVSKFPNPGELLAVIHEDVSGSDGIGPSEVHHYKVIEHLSNDRLKVVSLDYSTSNPETIIYTHKRSYYAPMYEE